ncbi:MAG: 4'-phosphopantetheinyl transferase family protein [Hyphomicrobiaceae bacterium]
MADVDAAGEALDGLDRHFALLTAEERARAGGLLPLQAEQWTRTRVALRTLLASRVGVSSAQSPFLLSAGGKPRLTDGTLAFSLSHSGRFVLIGLSPDGPVGVDIETRNQVNMHPDRLQAIEAAAIALAPDVPLPGHGDATRFTQAWTRLEALAKATGAGIGALLVSLGIRGPAATLDARTALDVGRLLIAEGCALRISDLRLGCAAAVAGPEAADVVLRRLPTTLKDLTDLSGLAG